MKEGLDCWPQNASADLFRNSSDEAIGSEDELGGWLIFTDS